MVGRVFEGWHLIVLIVVFMLLFGYKRLPEAARGVGRSLRIFKSEMKELQGEELRAGENTATGGRPESRDTADRDPAEAEQNPDR